MGKYSNEIALFTVVVVCWLVGLFMIRRNTARRLRPVFDRQLEINARPLDAVKAEVAQRLTEAANWSRAFATQPVCDARLDEVTNVFFSTYSAVADATELVKIDLDLVKDSRHAGYVVIGECIDDGEILLDCATGKTVEVAIGEQPGEGLEFTSVFHYLLFCMVSWEDAD